MKLVLIYGPPAVGKLTVARDLARVTGFKLHHNHATIDFVKSVFDFGTPTFWKLVEKFRKELIDEAANNGVDVIITFVYAKGSDDGFVRDIEKRVRRHGGELCAVRLFCDRGELLRRVRDEKRKGLGKLSTMSGLVQLLGEHDLNSEVPGTESLSIDTSATPPKAAAMSIVSHYRLETRRRKRGGSP